MTFPRADRATVSSTGTTNTSRNARGRRGQLVSQPSEDFETQLNAWRSRYEGFTLARQMTEQEIPQRYSAIPEEVMSRASTNVRAYLADPMTWQNTVGFPPPGIDKVEEEIRAEQAKLMDSLNWVIFYENLYGTMPNLVSVGAVNSVDEAISYLAIPDTMSEAELADVRTEIGNLLIARERLSAPPADPLAYTDSETVPPEAGAEGYESITYPELVAPEVTRAVPVTVSQLTTQEIVGALKSVPAPESTLSDEEWDEHLRSKGWSEEDIDNKLQITRDQLIAEAQNRKSLIQEFQANGAKLPEYKLDDYIQMSLIQPPLMALEALNIYYEHVTMPAAGWLYGKMVPDIEKARKEFAAANPDASGREALVYAWKEWDAPGPPVIDFALKYVVMEGVLDPLTYVGWGIASKGLRALGPAGRAVASVNTAIGRAMDLPFDFIKYVWSDVLPKTIVQRAGVRTSNGLSIVDRYFELATGQPLSFIKPADMYDAGQAALEHLIAHPTYDDDIAQAAKVLLAHPPVSKKEAINWSERIGATGLESASKDQMTDRRLLDLDDMFERVFEKELTPEEAAEHVLNILAIRGTDEATEEAYQTIVRILSNRANGIVERALDFTAVDTANKAMRSLSRKLLKTFTAVEDSAAVRAASKAGAFRAFMFDVDTKLISPWLQQLDRFVIRPAAESYLTFGLYGPMNMMEDFWRSIMGGVAPGKASLERWDIGTLGLLGDPELRRAGLSDMIGPLRETGEVARSNWMLTMSLTPLSVPTYLATRGKVTPRQFAKNTYNTLVELFGGVGADVRRNFVLGRMNQILADLGGDAFERLLEVVPKKLPSELDSLPSWAKKGLLKDLRDAVTTGKLSLDSKDLVSFLKSRYTRNRIHRAEVDNILMKYPDISPTSRSLIYKDYRTLLRSPQEIDNYMTNTVMAAEVDDFLKGPERAREQMTLLADQLTQLEVNRPNDLAEVIVSLHRMAQTYGAMPRQVLGRATIKSSGMPHEARTTLFDTEFDRLQNFAEKAGLDVDRVADKILTSNVGSKNFQAALKDYLNIVTEIRQETAAAQSRDMVYRSGLFGNATKADLKSNAWWDDFKAHELNFWNNVNKKNAGLNSRLIQAIDDINRTRGGRVSPRPAVIVQDRALAPNDVAQLLGVRGDDVSRLLLDNLLVEGDRDYFVEYVMGMVRSQDIGFNRESVGAVYDQICNSLLTDPTSSSWFRNREIEIRAMTQDFHDLYRARLFPKEQKEAVDALIDRVADDAGDLVGEEIVPTRDIGLAEELVEDNIAYNFERGEELKTQLEQLGLKTQLEQLGEKVEISDMETRGLSMFKELMDTDILYNRDVVQLVADVHEVGYDRMLEAMRDASIKDVRLMLNDAADSYGISGKLRSTLLDYVDSLWDLSDMMVREPSIRNLRDATVRWFKVADNESLQRLGVAAQNSPEYLEGIHNILREKYPTGYIRIFRGHGEAKHRFLDREFTNVSSSKRIAESFADTWGIKDVPDLQVDDIIVKVDDIVSIGSVDESELIIPARVLRERIENPLRPMQVTAPFTDYQQIRQQALDEAQKWYYKEYVDYTNANVVDAMFKTVYPFWTYESQRWFWLPRSFFRHPGTLTAWGRYENNTDYGYVHIPGTSIDIHPLRGTVYGTWSTRLMRRDYPEYYDNLGKLNGLVSFSDFLSRYGFYPNIIYGAALAQFGGREQQLGGILPSSFSTPLNALIAAFPDNELVTFISERIFPELFRNYLTARRVDDLGGDGSLLYAKRKSNQELSEEEDAMWTEARRFVATHSALFEQTGMMRMKSDQAYELSDKIEQFIYENWNITPEQQKYARQHNMKLWDIIGGLDPWESAAMEELDFWKYSGSINPVLPSHQQEILNRIELDWTDVRNYTDQQRVEIDRLQYDFLVGDTDRGKITADGFLTRVRALYDERRRYIDQKIKDNPYMELEYRTQRFIESGYTDVAPVMSPYNELMSLYFDIELKETVDPGTGERIYDWDKFWANREMITDAIPEADKAKWDEYLTRNTAPLMGVWHDVYNNYFRKYYDVWDAALKSYSEDEQKLIQEYLYLERNDTDLQRQAQIQEIISERDGKQLISSFRSEVSNSRAALRFANPHLDAWLFYWDRVGSFETPEAERIYRLISKQTGRVIK